MGKPPPLLSKLTFCQRTNNSEDINEQISLIKSSRRGAKTPNHQANLMAEDDHIQKWKASTELSDQLSAIAPMQGAGKTSCHTYCTRDVRSKHNHKHHHKHLQNYHQSQDRKR